jgi:hypothetical protein
MNCISSPEPEDRLLLAFLDGEVDHEMELHLQQCEYCCNRIKTLAREQNILSSRLYRISCPPTEELGEFHLRMLSAPQMLVVAQHIRECPHCTREMDQLKKFLSDLAPISRTKGSIARLVSGQGGSTVTGEPSFALRGEDKGPIIDEKDGIVVVLDIQPINEEKANILGQVAADDQKSCAGAVVELYQDNQLEISTTINDFGTFRFQGLLPGIRDLRIKLKSGSVSTFKISI